MSTVKPSQRLAGFWRYLPAFRAVAEYQHLRRAADDLHISPSALSRTIGLLEEELGVVLFHREGRNIQLSRAGSAFLVYVRRAMRMVDEGWSRASGASLQGDARIYANWALAVLARESLSNLVSIHPRLRPAVLSCDRKEVAALLTQGLADVVLSHVPLQSEAVESEQIGSFDYCVYVSDDHPLAGAGLSEHSDIQG
ncbi:MAG: LysR family transcriptional regulator, partial [Myxococcales bacterium]|nr:LysR family transcriptional regulator [Myxococcales bacterium]